MDLRTYDTELRNEFIRILYSDIISCSCLERKNSGGEEEEDPTKKWLDMKYCHLRKDIPDEKQLFDSLSVKITKEVVSLIEPASSENKNGRARCRQRRKQRRKEKLISTVRGMLDETGDCEDTADPTISNNHINEASTTTYQEFINTSNHQAAAGVDGFDYGSAVQIKDWEKYAPAIHLSPLEWNEKLLQYSRGKTRHEDDEELQSNNNNGSNDVILLDTRNIYETRIGHFAVPKLDIFFPNTRKFSSLPQALNTEQAASALAGKQVFMYCTGELSV